MVTLEKPGCSGLGAELRVWPGSRKTKGPSNISSGLTASASVSLSPEIRGSPLARLHINHKAWSRKVKALGKEECSRTLFPPCSCTRLLSVTGAQGGPKACVTSLDQGYNANIVLGGTREVFI